MTARDGALSVEGQLLSFDGEIFRVETPFGALTLDQSDVGCTGPGCPELTAYIAELDISGDADLQAGLTPALITTFAAAQGYRVVQRIELGVGTKFELFEPDTGQQVGTFRLIRSAELGDGPHIHLSREDAPWSDARVRIIALDGVVAAATDPKVGTTVDLFAVGQTMQAEVRDWSLLTGTDLPLDLYLPRRNTKAGATLEQWFLRDLQIDSADAVWSGARIGQPDVSNTLAFGFTALSRLGDGPALGLEGACGAAAFPTDAAIQIGEYPMAIPVALYRQQGRLPRLAREFVAYAASENARDPVVASGLVPLALFEIPFATQGQRLTNAILQGIPDAGTEMVTAFTSALQGQSRLSIAFRFQDGSTQLDAVSATNVERLAEAIAQGRFDDRRLTFVGLSDNVGESPANLRLSQRRAEAVQAAVSRQLTESDAEFVDLDATGFGEAVPIVCNETPENRRINRRVEIWVDQR